MSEVPSKRLHSPRFFQILSSLRWPTPEANDLTQAKEEINKVEAKTRREEGHRWIQTPRGWKLQRRKM